MRVTLMLGFLLSARLGLARPLTLSDAQSEAERQAQSVLVAERQADVARSEVQVAGTLANPSLTVIGSRLSGTSLGVSLPMPIFGQRGTLQDAARADAVASTLGVSLAQQEARYAAGAAWVDLWAAQKRATLLQRAAVTANRFLEIARTRFETGSAPRLDVLRAAAEQAHAAAEATAARTLIAAAAARLEPFLSESVETSEATAATLEATGEPAAIDRTLPPLEDLLVAALAHPLLHRDRAQATAAIAHVRAEQRLRWPMINGQFTVNVGDTAFSGTDFLGGLSFELPVLSLRGGAIARARAQSTVADAELRLDIRRVKADVRDAYHSLQAASGRAQALRTSVLPATHEAAALTEESYRQGRADLLRLLDAQRAVVEASLSEVEAMSALGKATFALERAVGRKFDAH